MSVSWCHVKHHVKFTLKQVLRKNMTNTHRMGVKLDARWLGPYKVEKITEKELHQLKCTRSGKVLKQAFSSLQLKPYICCSHAKVNAWKYIYLAFKLARQLVYYYSFIG